MCVFSCMYEGVFYGFNGALVMRIKALKTPQVVDLYVLCCLCNVYGVWSQWSHFDALRWHEKTGSFLCSSLFM